MNTKFFQVGALILMAILMSACSPVRESGLITANSSAGLAQDNLPQEGITFLDLTSTNASRNVFRARCASCHNENTPTAGLNVMDFNAAKAKSARILARMRSNTNPMPPNRQLADAEIRQVETWVQEGLR